MRRLVLAVVAAFVGATGARAQEASTAVVPETITVGDVFHAAVRVDVPAGAEVAFPDTLGLAGDDIETAGRVRIAVDTIGGAQRITAAYPLTAWRAGDTLQLPAVTYAVNEGGRQTLHTAAFPEFVLSSVLTGCAVSTAGAIGFVGLVTPHLVRLALGNDQRVVLAGSALLGGLLLMAADLASRMLLAPRQLPVGALTALVGVPIFLLLMLRQRS